MPRNVTVTLSSGEPLQFVNVPNDVTPEQIQARAEAESGGASIVSIDGGRPSTEAPVDAPTDGAPADAVPMDGVAPQAPQEDVAGYEGALRGLYQRYAEKKQPFNTADIAALASQYNVGNITNLPEIEEFYNKHGTLNPSLKSVSLDAPAAPTPEQDKMIGAVPQGSNNAQRARAFAKGFAFDFNDELEAAARTFMSGEMSADEYYRLKKQINDDYNAWAQANQAEAFGLELGGGIASSFLPLGAVTKGFQAGSKLANVGTRAAASGALSGAVTGVGQAETFWPSDVVPSVLENAAMGAVTGGVFGKGAEYTGRGASIAKQKYLEKFGPGLEVYDEVAGRFVRVPETPLTAADRRAAEIITDAAGPRGPQRAIGATALANRQGVPLRLGTSNPELTALADKVATKASSGQEGLIKNIIESRTGTADRVSAQAEAALPGSKDYFDEEEAITDRLRAIGNTEYQRAYAVGEVNDPAIAAIINNPSPVIRSIWQSTKNLAQLKGSDLRMGMEPVLDAGGNLVGLAPTANAVPDVEALDLFKRALDDRIEKGFRGTSSEGKSEAAALKDIRNAMVSRLDELVPAYRAARTKYAGDLEVRDAMRYGLDVFSRKVRPAEFQKTVAKMSDAEKEAVKTGGLEAVFRTLEGASGGDLAKKLAGTPEKLQKLKTIMGPQEAKFFERVMQKESQLYQRTSKITGGSPTAGRLEGLDALDNMIQNGNLDEAVNFLMAGPTGKAVALGRFVAKFNPRKEFGDQVYTKLSRALSAQKPEELREVLDMLRRSQSYTDYMTSVKNFAGGRGASVAGTVVPTVLEERGFEPPPSAEIDPAAEAAAAEEMAATETDGLAYSSEEEIPFEETTEAAVPEMGTVMINGREAQLGEDGRMYYVDDNTPADGVSMGMYRGGRVQAFNKGGMASIADMARHYGMRR